MKIFKNFCLLFLFLLYGIVFFALCFSLNLPLIVLEILLVLLCFLLLAIYFLGDRIILAIVKAQELPRVQIEVHEPYRRRVENVACLMDLGAIDIYRAETLPSDIFVLKGMGNTSCIIIGGDAFAHLSEKEINALVYFSILKIKKLNLRFVQMCNFFFFMVSFPTIMMKKFKPLKFVGLIIDFFLLPLWAFKKFAFKENNNYLEELMKKLEMDDLANTIQAAFFKLRCLSFDHSGDVSEILLSDLASVERKIYE